MYFISKKDITKYTLYYENNFAEIKEQISEKTENIKLLGYSLDPKHILLMVLFYYLLRGVIQFSSLLKKDFK